MTPNDFELLFAAVILTSLFKYDPFAIPPN